LIYLDEVYALVSNEHNRCTLGSILDQLEVLYQLLLRSIVCRFWSVRKMRNFVHTTM